MGDPSSAAGRKDASAREDKPYLLEPQPTEPILGSYAHNQARNPPETGRGGSNEGFGGVFHLPGTSSEQPNSTWQAMMTRLDDTRERLLEGGAAEQPPPPAVPTSTDVLLLPPPPTTSGVDPTHLTPEARYSAADSQASSASSSPVPNTPQPRNSESPEGLASRSYRAPQPSSLGRTTPSPEASSGFAPKPADPYLLAAPSSYQSNTKYSDGISLKSEWSRSNASPVSTAPSLSQGIAAASGKPQVPPQAASRGAGDFSALSNGVSLGHKKDTGSGPQPGLFSGIPLSSRAEVRLPQPSAREGSSLHSMPAGSSVPAGGRMAFPSWRLNTSSSAAPPPPPRPSSPPMPATFTVNPTMHMRVEEDLGRLVRAVVGSSRLKTEPTRLELQLVCQELVSQVKSYFAKLEESVPSRGEPATSAETLSVRMAALGAKGGFSPPLRSSHEAPAERLTRWASPPTSQGSRSYFPREGNEQQQGGSVPWKYSDRSPPLSTYERTYSALDSFQRKWAVMGSGSDGRPLSPSARLRQEKLKLAQRSADLIDEKLQAYGISPVRASRLYHPGRTSLKGTVPSFHVGSPQSSRQHTTSTFAGSPPRSRSPMARSRPASSVMFSGRLAATGTREARPRSSPPASSSARLREALGERISLNPRSRSPARARSPGLDRLRDFTSNLMRGGAASDAASASSRDWAPSSSKGNSAIAPSQPSSRRKAAKDYLGRPASSPGRAGRSSAYDRLRRDSEQSGVTRRNGSAYDFRRADSDGRRGGLSPWRSRPPSITGLRSLSPRPQHDSSAAAPRSSLLFPPSERPFPGPAHAARYSSQPVSRLQALSNDFSSRSRR